MKRMGLVSALYTLYVPKVKPEKIISPGAAGRDTVARTPILFNLFRVRPFLPGGVTIPLVPPDHAFLKRIHMLALFLKERLRLHG
jgi:hypothetical protein